MKVCSQSWERYWHRRHKEMEIYYLPCTLCCITTAGGIVPILIFPSERFGYSSLEGGVDNSYFGKSPSGWMTQELLYGWLTCHFVHHITPARPVCVLLDTWALVSYRLETIEIILQSLPNFCSHIHLIYSNHFRITSLITSSNNLFLFILIYID